MNDFNLIRKNGQEKIVSFNVGGMVFETLRETITSDKKTVLYSILNSDLKTLDSKDRIFLDRDPQLFRHILYFLRTGSLEHDITTHKLEDLYREADFLQLETCMDAIQSEITCREWNNALNWRFMSLNHNKSIIIILNVTEEESKKKPISLPRSVRLEVSTSRKTLFKVRGKLRIVNCMGHALPGITPARDRHGQIIHHYTSNDKLKELPPKSIFFLCTEQKGDLSLLEMMQMDHMIHQDWPYYWSKLPDLQSEGEGLEFWTAPITQNKHREPPTK